MTTFRMTYYQRRGNIVRVAFNADCSFAEADFGSRKEVRRVVSATENVPANRVDVPLSLAQPITKEGQEYRCVWDVCILEGEPK